MGVFLNKVIVFLQQRFHSFGYAGKGVSYLMRTEAQFKVHLFLGAIVVFLGVWLHISFIEWAVISLAMGMVFCAEAFNTAIEHWVNWLSPERCPEAGKVKDIAAAAVLLASLGALGVGFAVFLPKLFV